jgi:two-component system, NarL family, sensor histidine kinase UhpB
MAESKVMADGGDAEVPPLTCVLIVDDSEIDAELLRMRLQAQYPSLTEIHWVREPASVLDEIAERTPDLVITDYHIPGYDLVATVTELRARWPTLPVLVMSGLVGEEAAIQVLKAGANDFLAKSRSESLPMVIARELAEAHAERTRIRLKADLEAQRRLNEAIIDQMPAGVWILSPAGVIERTNRHGAAMMGGSPRIDIEGLARIEGWWTDTGEPIRAHDWPGARALERGEQVPPRLMRVRTYRGELRELSCGAAPLHSEGGSLLGAVITAVDMTAEVELRRRLAEARTHLRKLSVNQSLQHEQQMTRVSRELHDNLGQVLSLLKLHLGSAANRELSVARRQLEVDEALPLVDLALNRLREVCNDLRPTELSDFGLGVALASLCAAAARASGIDVSIAEEGAPRTLDGSLQVGLFRVAQQALTNALRHAGAETVRMVLNWRDDAVALCVSDDGSGFDLAQPRLPTQQGLRGMRERIELLDGELEIASTPGSGTRIVARIPVLGNPSGAV